MPFLTVKRRRVCTDPLYDDETGEQIGWYTKGADWYIARGERRLLPTRYLTSALYICGPASHNAAACAPDNAVL